MLAAKEGGVPNTIKQLREDRGWSQAELARRVGVHAMSVSYWEIGRYEPKASQLKALAAAFGVSMDDIDFWTPGANREKDGADDQ